MCMMSANYIQEKNAECTRLFLAMCKTLDGTDTAEYVNRRETWTVRQDRGLARTKTTTNGGLNGRAIYRQNY